MKKSILFSFVLLFLTAPALTYAQSSASEATAIGPRFGYYQAGDAEEGNFYGGLQARARLSPILGVEGLIEYRAAQRYEFDTEVIDVSFIPITGSLLFFAPISENFSPYGLAGLGIHFINYEAVEEVTEAEGTNNDIDYDLGFHLGGGVELSVSSNVAINIDYRYSILSPDDNTQHFDDTQSTFDGHVFTAGVLLYL